MDSIHSVLGGQSAPGFQVSHTMPRKSNNKTPHHEAPGWSVNWWTSYHSVAAVQLDWDLFLRLKLILHFVQGTLKAVQTIF